MADNSGFTERLLVKQKSMFRQAAKAGFTQDLIHGETDLPTTSLSEWATGKTKMSLGGFLRIAAIEDFPSELLSLLMEGTGRHVADDGIDEGDHDTLAGNCVDFIGKHARARHPESPAGIEIAPCEDTELRASRRQLRAMA